MLSSFTLPTTTSLDEILVLNDNVAAMGGMQEVDLAFESIAMTLTTKKGTKELLDGTIRGRARPGRMLAIMGPSGKYHTVTETAIIAFVKSRIPVLIFEMNQLCSDSRRRKIYIGSCPGWSYQGQFKIKTVRQTIHKRRWRFGRFHDPSGLY